MDDERFRHGKLERLKLQFIDVKKAHPKGIVPDDEFVYTELPPCEMSEESERARGAGA